MSDNRPSVGYIVLWSGRPSSWSSRERRLYLSEACQVIPAKSWAQRMITATTTHRNAIVAKATGIAGWTYKDFRIVKCVSARQMVVP